MLPHTYTHTLSATYQWAFDNNLVENSWEKMKIRVSKEFHDWKSNERFGVFFKSKYFSILISALEGILLRYYDIQVKKSI